MARTAVVAGTATAVSGGMRRHAAQREADAQEATDAQEAQVPVAPPPIATEDRIAKLKELGELKAAGVLTDDEFAAEKARILAG